MRIFNNALFIAVLLSSLTLRAGADETLTMNEYLKKIGASVESKWNRPPHASFKRHDITPQCTVVFRIGTDGQISNLRLSKSSTSAVFDQSAIKAVQASTPFDAPPAEVTLITSFEHDGTSKHVKCVERKRTE